MWKSYTPYSDSGFRTLNFLSKDTQKHFGRPDELFCFYPSVSILLSVSAIFHQANINLFAMTAHQVKGTGSRFAHLEKFSLTFSSSSFVIRVNLLHPYQSMFLYDLLSCGSVSQGLGTTKFMNLIGWNAYWPRSRPVMFSTLERINGQIKSTGTWWVLISKCKG